VAISSTITHRDQCFTLTARPTVCTAPENTRKGGNYSDALPLKAARRDSIWGFKSELHTNPMPFYLELLWGATLMPHRGCDGLGQNKIVRVGKNSGPVLNRL